MTRWARFLLVAGLLCGAAPLGAQFTVPEASKAQWTLRRMFVQNGAFGLAPYAADPFTCSAATERATYYNTATHVNMFCDGTAWTEIGGGGPVSTTTVVGTTSVCGGGAAAAANSVCLSANTITAEGSSADASEFTVTFANPTADQDLGVAADGNGITLTAQTAASNLTLSATNNLVASPTAALTLTGGTTAALTATAGAVTVTAASGSNINLVNAGAGVLGIPSDGAANSISITPTGSIVGEGTTADANETTIGFGDAAADRTLFVTAQAATGTVRLSTTAVTPSNFIDIRGSDILIGGASVSRLAVRSDGLVGIDGSTQLVFGGASDPTGSGGIGLSRQAAGIMKVTDASTGGGQLRIGGGDPTAATMTMGPTIAQARDVTTEFTWTNAQVVALGAATTGDITVTTLPAKTQMLDALVVITGAAAGPATVTVSCGDAIGGTPFINYVVPSDAKAAANTVYGDAVAERGTSIDTEFYYLPSYTATTLVTCHYISTVANLNTVTGSTGKVILTTRLLP